MNWEQAEKAVMEKIKQGQGDTPWYSIQSSVGTIMITPNNALTNIQQRSEIGRQIANLFY